MLLFATGIRSGWSSDQKVSCVGCESSLIALMKDQVAHCSSRGLKAGYI